jgi:hypothetical protein
MRRVVWTIPATFCPIANVTSIVGPVDGGILSMTCFTIKTTRSKAPGSLEIVAFLVKIVFNFHHRGPEQKDPETVGVLLHLPLIRYSMVQFSP